jgi:hypothetical protein
MAGPGGVPINPGLPGTIWLTHRTVIATRAVAPARSLAPRQSPSLVKLESVLIFFSPASGQYLGDALRRAVGRAMAAKIAPPWARV